MSNWNNVQDYIILDLGVFCVIHFHCSWKQDRKNSCLCFAHQTELDNNLKSISKFILLIFIKFVNSLEKTLNTRLVVVFPHKSMHMACAAGRNGSLLWVNCNSPWNGIKHWRKLQQQDLFTGPFKLQYVNVLLVLPRDLWARARNKQLT